MTCRFVNFEIADGIQESVIYHAESVQGQVSVLLMMIETFITIR